MRTHRIEYPDYAAYEYDLLRLCGDLHSIFTGSSDLVFQPNHKVVTTGLVNFLKHRIANWQSSPPYTQKYDDAVKTLIECAIKDGEEIIKREERMMGVLK